MTITAAANGKTATSAAINIGVATDSYRTKASGNWSDYPTVWQHYNGTTG